MTATIQFQPGDVVYEALPGHCSHCGAETTATLGVVVEPGIYGSYIVSLVDRSYPHPGGTQRLVCSPEELCEVGPGYDGVIHASPEDVAAAVDAGWLEPGAEFYSCQFR